MPRTGCDAQCGGAPLDFDFTMAFQPIADTAAQRVYAFEALVRGLQGEGAASVLARVDGDNRYRFDQACRTRAIALAAKLGLPAVEGALLSINFMPNAVYEPAACIRATVLAARRARFPLDRLMFEFTEGEPVEHGHLGRILSTYRALGFKTAIDDFGAGYSGLTLLAKLQPDVVKLDMELIRDIDTLRVKQVLVKAMVDACAELGVTVVAEGIETAAESALLRAMGVDLQQGYLLARPGFESLPAPVWPAARSDGASIAA